MEDYTLCSISINLQDWQGLARRWLDLEVVDHTRDPRDAPHFLLRLGLHLRIGHLARQGPTPLVTFTSTLRRLENRAPVSFALTAV